MLFLQDSEEEFFNRWDYMLGLVWTPDDIAKFSKKNRSSSTQDSSGVIRWPLSFLVRPEVVDHLSSISDGMGEFGLEMNHVPEDAISMSNLSKDEYLKRMGATPASSPQEEDEYDLGTYNMDPTSFGGFRQDGK